MCVLPAFGTHEAAAPAMAGAANPQANPARAMTAPRSGPEAWRELIRCIRENRTAGLRHPMRASGNRGASAPPMIRLRGTGTPPVLGGAGARRYRGPVAASDPRAAPAGAERHAGASRVLIVEDHDFARMGLVSAVRLLGCEVIADVATAAEAVRAARITPPDVALLDLDLGEGPTGIDLAHALRRLDPSIGLVVISAYEDPRLLGFDQQALPDDVVHLVKQRLGSPGELGRAIRAAHRHERAPAAVAPELASLSAQQVEIMRLVAAGCSNAEIARRRSITEPAAAKAVARLIRHFGIQADASQNQRVLITQLYQRLSGGRDPHAG
jgi:DNA-binding NarL/FixJ family response regulator